MRNLFLAAALGAVTLTAVPAAASNPYRDHRHDMYKVRQDCRRDLRHADNMREVRDARRDCRHDMRKARRDYRHDLRR
jgi:Spy/CpxP family protein refolding chaperone